MSAGIEFAYALMDNGDIAQAQQIATRLAQKASTQPEVLQLQGLAFESMGQLEEAEFVYRKALSLDQDSDSRSKFSIKLANNLLNQNRHELAGDAYQSALSWNPQLNEDVEFNYGLACSFVGVGDTLRGKELLKKCLKLSPDYLDAHKELAKVFFQEGEYQSSINTIDAALKINRSDPELWNNLALNLSEIREKEQAISAFTRAIDLNPHFASAYCGRAIEFFNAEEYTNAIEDLTQAIKNQENYAIAYFYLGMSFVRIEELRKGASAFAKLIKLEPDQKRGWHSLGTTLYHLKKFNCAEKSLVRAVENDPTDPWSYAYLSESLTAMWKFDDALTWLEKGIDNTKADPRGNGKLVQMKNGIIEYLAQN